MVIKKKGRKYNVGLLTNKQKGRVIENRKKMQKMGNKGHIASADS